MDADPDDVDESELLLHDPRVMDIRGRLVDSDLYHADDIDDIVGVLNALYRWRQAENRLSEASRRYMHLGENDMKALRYIILREDRDQVATAGGIADHLGISTAATTKLLDRLEHAGHITRTRHPTDRRALAIRIVPKTRQAAQATVGREHTRRFEVIAGLTRDERAVVRDVLSRLSETTEKDWEPGPLVEPQRN